MKISWNWLSSLLDTEGLSPQEAAELLTLSGLEIEGIEVFGQNEALDSVVVAEIVSMEPHPNADKLSVCQVRDGQGGEERQIVCGAKNMQVGDKVPLALPGTQMPAGFKIKKSKLRGVVSNGMLCGSDELELGEDEDGLMLLPGELEVGAPVLKALQLGDTVLDISVTPNRPDALSHLGVARDLAALTGRSLKWPGVARQWRAASRGEALPAIEEPWKAIESQAQVGDKIQVELQDAQGCPRYAVAVMEDLKVGPSPRWMRNRLMAVGQRPINNLVDVTNYVLLECGQPLHAFDLDKIRGGKLIIRKAQDGEPIKTLDGQERKLAAEDVVIADAEGAVAVAGAMGGAGSEVSEGTSRVAIECAHFDASAVRRTARRLAIHSESSHRFERGVDPAGVPFFLLRAVELVMATQEALGVKPSLAQGVLDVYPTPIQARQVDLPVADYSRLIGVDLGATRMREVLDSLDLVAQQEGDVLQVRVPSFRPDIERPVDVIEEIARIEGYESLEPVLPQGMMGFSHQLRQGAEGLQETLVPLEDEQALRAARQLLLGRGLREAINYNFIDAALLEQMGFAQDDVRAHPVVVRNPLSEKTGVMRTSLLPGLLSNLVHNRSHRAEGANLFEVGRVYLRSDLEQVALPEQTGGERWVGHAEPTWIAAVLADPAYDHFLGARAWDLHDARAMVQDIAAQLSRRPVTLTSLEGRAPQMLHPYACAAVQVDGVEVGWLGSLHPDVLSRLKIEGEVFAFSLDASRLMALRQPLAPMEPIPRYPASLRDFALAMDAKTTYAQVEEALRGLGDKRLVGFQLFDVYEGEQLGQGRKSMAIKVTLRDPEGTLSEEVLASLQSRIVSHLEETLGAEQR